jgi:photosystem II stability/assembly factor-like uncharacterized protein
MDCFSPRTSDIDCMVSKHKFIIRLALVLRGLFAFANAAQPQSKQSFQALQFDSIHMIDRENGWARNARAVLITNTWIFNEKAVWKTTNGGKSWNPVLDASPADTGNISAFYQDSKTAWVAVADESTNVIVFRTTDGGRSWIRSLLSQDWTIFDTCLSFSSKDQGWLMLIPDHGMNSSPGILYRTGNGGADWQLVNSTAASPPDWNPEDATYPGFDNRHPFLLCGGPIAFRNNSIGSMWGSLASTTPGYLFVTQDGGLNWQVRHLSLPAAFQLGRMEPIGLPQFFHSNINEGIFPAEFRPTDGVPMNSSTVIYHTHDGGFNWQPTTPVKFSAVSSFIGVKKGWIWSPLPHGSNSTAPVKGTLYRTKDGGVSWKPMGTEKGLRQYLTHGEDIVQLDFIDEEHGWAIARDGHNLTQLLQTTNGGETWVSTQKRLSP